MVQGHVMINTNLFQSSLLVVTELDNQGLISLSVDNSLRGFFIGTDLVLDDIIVTQILTLV